MKLIIEIPNEMYECVQNGTYCGTLYEELKNGTPLSESEDCVSRQYLIEKATSWKTHFTDSERYVSLTDIQNAPPVTPTEKQEPCDDAISRQAAINIVVCDILSSAIVYGRTEEGMLARKAIVDGLKQLPPVKPEPCEDAVSREDALQALCKAVHKNDDTIPCLNQRVSCLWDKTKVQDYAKEILKLPPIKPEQKIGHWIKLDNCSNGGYYCSECQKRVVKEGWSDTVKIIKYCPNCGAKIEG